MNRRILFSYLILLSLSLLLHAMHPANRYAFALLPLCMFVLPVVYGHHVRFRMAAKDFLLGLVVSGVILLPYYFLFDGNAQTITVEFALLQLLGVAFPEEFFFRGFLQDSIGRSIKAVMFVSLLFSLAHLPKALFLGEWMSLLSFFPSLVMGWLYARTQNILPGILFHLFANVVNQAVLH